jgi:ribosomal protein L32
MSFGLTIYELGIVPDTSDAHPKHYHLPNHICNACSRVLHLCTLSLHSRLQTTL